MRGEGGVNTAFLTFGFKLFNKISLGFTANYEFGSLEPYHNSVFLDGVELDTRVESNSSLSGVSLNYSLLFREKISKDLTLHATYIINPTSKLSSNNTQTLSTIPVLGGYGGDAEEIDLGALSLDKTKITVPKSQTFGLGIGIDTKWFVGAEYTLVDGGGLNNKLFNLKNVDFKKGSKFSIGGFYIPNLTPLLVFLVDSFTGAV